MSLAEKQTLLNLIINYSRSQNRFLSMINIFNPETQIIECSRSFSTLPELRLSRTVEWQELRSSIYEFHEGIYETGPQYFTTSDQDLVPINVLLESIDLHNLHSYLKSDISLEGELLAFYIQKLTWFIRLWSDRWGYAPPYAPKTLSSGIQVIMDKEGLITSFRTVSKADWYPYELNPTKIIPLTTDNFAKVLAFHSQEAIYQLAQRKK